MQSEIEKLRKEREDEIRQNNQASLYLQEQNASKVVSTLFAIMGFLKSCNEYTTAFGPANGVTTVVSNRPFFGIFLFLDIVIYPAVGALIGWILIKIIFALIRTSK